MAIKPTDDIIASSDEDEMEVDEGYHSLLEVEKAAKKELKPGQKAVMVRRRIEDYLENKWMRDYYGVDVDIT